MFLQAYHSDESEQKQRQQGFEISISGMVYDACLVSCIYIVQLNTNHYYSSDETHTPSNANEISQNQIILL